MANEAPNHDAQTETAAPAAPTDFAETLRSLDEGEEVTFSTFTPGLGCSQSDITGTVAIREVETGDGQILGPHRKTTVVIRADKAERLGDDHPAAPYGTENFELSTVETLDDGERRTGVTKLGGVGGGLNCGYLTDLSIGEEGEN